MYKLTIQQYLPITEATTKRKTWHSFFTQLHLEQSPIHMSYAAHTYF